MLIIRCDPKLGTGPLTFAYLIRGLAGRPATLRITAETFPGGIVHERGLAPVETEDGRHDTEWDAIVTSAGKMQGQRLTGAYGSGKIEIIHDASYRDHAAFTIPQPKVVLVEVGGLCFETDREVLLPDTVPLAATEPGPARVPSLPAIAAAVRFAHSHPKKSVFVGGHADTVGRDADNHALSEARARNIQLYLSGDREGWVEHCLDNYDTADQQRILAWVSRSFPEHDCDPGAIDNDMGPITRGAQNAFRKIYAEQEDESMPVGDELRAADWQAFYSLYDRALQALLGETLNLQAERDKLVFADPAFAGFGDRFLPTGRIGTTSRASATVGSSSFSSIRTKSTVPRTLRVKPCMAKMQAFDESTSPSASSPDATR